MENRWHTTLFNPGAAARDAYDAYRDTRDAPFREFVRNGDPRVEAAGDRVERRRQLAQDPRLPESAGAHRRGGGGVPFSAASGADLRPYGEDFADWANMVDTHRRRPLPDYMRDQPAAEPEPPRRGLEPAGAGASDFDADMEWRSAQARARAAINLSAGHPTPAEMLFGLIFGNPGGETTPERQTRELREDVERRRINY